MRFHTLTLTAFGAFPGTERIDVDALSADGLFLLNGRTGSGKTTVLDAITFALYGDVPGRRDARGLQSHHAPPDRVPEVVLEFSLDGRRRRITRTPQHTRPSRRAKTGSVKGNPTAVLQEHDGVSWREVTSGTQAVGKEMHEILPLDRAQFTQVILLPQGQFAEFLHAGSAEKQKLLQRLFDTSIFRRLEEQAVEEARLLGRRLEEVETRVAENAEIVRHGASQLLAPALGGSAAGPVEALVEAVAAEELEDAVEQLAAWHARDLAVDAEVAAEQAERVGREAEELRLLRTRLLRARQHRDELARHDAAAEEIAAARAALTADEQAAEILRWVASADQASENAARRRTEAEDAVAGTAEALADQQDIPVPTPLRRDEEETSDAEAPDSDREEVPEENRDEALEEALETALAESSQLRGRLTADDVAGLEEAQGRRRRRRAELIERLQELDAAQAERTGRQQEVAAEIERAEAARRDPEELDAAVDVALAGERRAARRVELVEQRDADAARVAELAATLQAREESRQEAAAAHRELLDRHLALVAQRLSEQLEPGAPCAVCGSTEHPDPAHRREDAEPITEQQVEDARQEAVAAQTAREQTQAQLRVAEETEAETRRRLAELAGETGETGEAAQAAHAVEAAASEPTGAAEAVDVDAARDLHQAARRRRAGAEEARTAQRRLLEQLEESRRRRETLRAGLHELSTERSAAAAEVERLDEETTATEETLARLRGEHASVEDRVAAVDALRSRLTRAREAVRLSRQATAEAEQAAARAAERIADSDFADRAALAAARLDPSVRQEHEARIVEHDRRAQRLQLEAEAQDVVDGLRRLERGEDLPEEETVLDAERRAAARAEDAETAEAIRRRFADRRGDLAVPMERLRRALVEREERSADQRRRRELADTLTGHGPDNTLRMTLTSYVLAARLEKVALAATRHLQTMSEGRYQLLHDDSASGGGLRGLDLKVHDEHSDHERPTSSLSGGETFMAALAMALGLAEVVQAEAGGIGMESLFIDEGFGSLDEESLEHVMAALHRLQGEGRRVGVVSHVTEMHRAIPTQLQVDRGRRGSSLRLVLPDGEVSGAELAAAAEEETDAAEPGEDRRAGTGEPAREPAP